MTNSGEKTGRRQYLKTIAALGVTASTAGCISDIRDRLPFDNEESTPAGGGSTPEPTPEPTSTPNIKTATEESDETPEPENTFKELDNQIPKIETDSSLKKDLGPNFDDSSLELYKEVLKERDIEDVEDWGLYATIDITGVNNWDDVDGIYRSGDEGKRQLENLLSRAGTDIFRTINRYAGDLINRDRINLDSVSELGIIFEDDEGETVGYIAGEEDLEEIYSSDSLADAYGDLFRDGMELYPLEENEG